MFVSLILISVAIQFADSSIITSLSVAVGIRGGEGVGGWMGAGEIRDLKGNPDPRDRLLRPRVVKQ